MKAKELAERLASDTLGVCKELLPDGRIKTGEWCVGSVMGEEGQSLRVHLSGDKAGIWCDFAAGERGGDLLDLWAATRRLSIGEAIAEAKSYLGIPDTERTFQNQPRKQYANPDPSAFSALTPDGPVAAYLQERGLSDAIIHKARIVETHSKQGPVVVFRYFRDKEHLHTKFLCVDRPDGNKVTWCSKNTRPILYGWHLIPPRARKVILVEGELDCLTLNQFGLPALSVPMGAGNKQGVWLEHEFDHLDRFDEIIVGMDNDEAGHEARDQILDRLGLQRCRVVEWPKNDPNGCLAGLSWGRDDFIRQIRAARAISPEELAAAEDYRQEVKNLFLNIGASPLQHLRLPWLPITKPLEFAPGELTVWTGANGHGKTTALNHAINYAIGLDYRVCIASLEIKPAQTLAAMARQATALANPAQGYLDAVFDYYADKLWIFRVVGKAKTDRMLEVFVYAKARFGVQHFIVDSLLMLDVGYEDWTQQTDVAQKLTGFAVEHDVHVHLVAHAKKVGEGRTVGRQDVRGAGGITDLASNVIVVWANEAKQINPEATGPDAQLIIDKNRRHGWRGIQHLDFDPDSLQMVGGEWYRPMSHVPYSNQHAAHG